MTKNKFLGLLTAIVIAATPSFAADFSQTETSTFPAARPLSNSDESMPNIGIMVGTHVPDDDGLDAATDFGIDVMFQPYIPFGVGLEATYSEPETDDALGLKIKETTVLAKVQYNFGGSIPVIRDSFIGVGAGAQFQDSEITDETDTKFAAAPIIGFDIPLKNENDQAKVSLGANAKYLYVEGDDEIADSDAVSVNGVVRYWY